MKNQHDDTPAADWEQMSEAFHKSLFDLEILTNAFLEGQYVPAARVVVMTRNATTPRGNDILRFALAEIHELYSHIEKSPVMTQYNGYSMNMVLIFELKALIFLTFRTFLSLFFLKKPKIDRLK